MRFQKTFGLVLMLLLSVVEISISAPPDLRDQVLLNGTWSTGGTVPAEITISGTTAKTFQREVTVPSSWTGKTIKLEFDAVNYVADVFVNGNLVTSHVGGWVPFDVDITNKVSAGNTFTLRVDVKGSMAEPIIVNGQLNWMVGADYQVNLSGMASGIVGDVFLRAYGTVAITDAFIKTSFRNKTIFVDYTIKNFGTTSRNVSLTADITPATTSTIVKQIAGDMVTLNAGEEKNVTLSAQWSNPLLWGLKQPNLYLIVSRVKDGQTTVDQETRRFGFREVWSEGNFYYLNGVRINFRGDNWPHGGVNTWPGDATSTASRADVCMNQLNMNIARFHMNPTPPRAMDACDEKGFLIINESCAYGRDYTRTGNHDSLFSNTKKWIKPWIKSARNHPSVVRWSGSNECAPGWSFDTFTFGQVRELADSISSLDPTRPVSLEEGDVRGGTACIYHYIEGYLNSPSGSIYSWAIKVFPGKPTGIGEFLTSYGSNATANQWWQGTWGRGLRFSNFADIRPYTSSWAINGSSTCRTNLINSYAPVALFDEAYDDLGIAPVKDGTYPAVNEGDTLVRRLVVYNDEFSDSVVRVIVSTKSATTTYATGACNVVVPLGFHKELACTLLVPYVGGSTFDLVLSTSKAGIITFSENKTFRVADKGLSGTVPGTIGVGPYVGSLLIGDAVVGKQELGTKFIASQSGYITGIRFFKPQGETGTHTGYIWTFYGTQRAVVTFASESPSGWQTATLSTPFLVTPNISYVVSVNANTKFYYEPGGLRSAVYYGSISTVPDNANGVYGWAGVFPSKTDSMNTNYFREVIFEPGVSIKKIQPSMQLLPSSPVECYNLIGQCVRGATNKPDRKLLHSASNNKKHVSSAGMYLEKPGRARIF